MNALKKFLKVIQCDKLFFKNPAMNSFLKKIALLVTMIIPSFSFVYAQTGTENTTSNTLAIIQVNPVSPREIDVTFSEPINITTLRTTLENQITRDMVSVSGYHETSNPNVARVELSSEMATSATYKITVNTVTSANGATINAGIDATKEFVTPARFSEDKIDLTAPSNPLAVTAEPQTSTGETTEQVIVTDEVTTTGATNEKIETTALPETGMGMFSLFGVFAIAISGFMITMNRRKNS